MSFSIQILPALADNYTYLVSDTALGLAMVIDPSDADVVRRALEKEDLHLALILNTHHHSDHTGGNAKLQQDYGAPIIGPRKEMGRIDGISRGVETGDVITFSDLRGQVIETPGHTVGSTSYFFPSIKALFSGDTLFSLGCGRLFEGTAHDMWDSLVKLRSLPDDTNLYAGHEYTQKNIPFALMLDKDNEDLKARAREVTELRKKDQPTMPVTMEIERKTNPFLRVDDPVFQEVLTKNGLSADANPAALFGSLRAAKDRFKI